MRTRILFRADGDSFLGLGHVVRSLALVSYLKADFDCLFITNSTQKNLIEMISASCPVISLNAHSLDEELESLSKIVLPADIFVIDGYQFGHSYQAHIKKLANKLVMIDDRTGIEVLADVIINHGAQFKGQYLAQPTTEILKGFDYLIVRDPFLKAARKTRLIDKVDTVFICMGGADPFNITHKALLASIRCRFAENIIIVIGSAYRWAAELSTFVKEVQGSKKISIEVNVSDLRMVELIRSSEIAICPASSVALEVCAVKSGLLTGRFVDNQDLIHNQVLESGCCVSIYDFNTVSVDEIEQTLNDMESIKIIQQLINKQTHAIDGYSNERILKAFKHLAA